MLMLWAHARINRVGITKSTRKGIEKRCNSLVRLLDSDCPLDERTVMKVLEAPGQYSYRHRMAKKLLWCAKWCVENGLLKTNPLVKVRIPQPKFTHRKVFLTVTEVAILQSLPLSGTLEKIRDTFLLQCYTGLAYADVRRVTSKCLYRAQNMEFISMERQKTSSGFLTPLRKEARAILDKWNWIVKVPCNQVYNRMLKELGRLAGLLQPLFSHLGRKTFAQYYTERGLSLQITAEMMGITDPRILTQHYATITPATIANGLNQLL